MTRRVSQTKPKGPARADTTPKSVSRQDPVVRVDGFDIGSEPTIEFAPKGGIRLDSMRATGRVKVTVDGQAILDLIADVQSDVDLALSSCCELVVDDNVTSPPSTVYTDDGVDWVYDDPHW